MGQCESRDEIRRYLWSAEFRLNKDSLKIKALVIVCSVKFTDQKVASVLNIRSSALTATPDLAYSPTLFSKKLVFP